MTVVIQAKITPRSVGPFRRQLARDIATAMRRLPRLAGRDVTRLYRQHVLAAIDLLTKRRTGNLRRLNARRRAARGAIIVTTNFPRTAYVTPPSRGRPTASKRGQYAAIVNHRRRFIQLANRNTRLDPRLTAILQRHLALELQRLFNRRRTR